MTDLKKAFRDYVKEKKHIIACIETLQWELETLVPKKGQAYLSEVLGYMSMQDYNLSTSKKVEDCILALLKEKENLDPILRKEVEDSYEEMEKMKKIPAEDYQAYAELCAKTQGIWEEAKAKNDFSIVEENLAKIFDYSRKFAKLLQKDEDCLYDVLLKDYEKGMTSKKLDAFFAELKAEIVPLLHKIQEKKHALPAFWTAAVDCQKQKDFSKFLAAYMGFDFESGVLAESVHPFTLQINKHDVRITTNYTENLAFSSIFSTIHETGHAIYEQQIADNLLTTLLGQGGSMGLHESQSRFWENIIGRSKAFWKPIYPTLQENFSCLEGISLEDFHRGVNHVEASLIRTESDELTYSLHIMLRYELEKDLLEGRIEVKDLPELWKKKVKEYLGIEVPTDALGVLQDVHWYGGLIGYFPSYALGNAYASQIFHSMPEMQGKESYSKEDIDQIRHTLGEHIHQYGCLKETPEIIRNFTGEDLNAKYYTDYLTEKYTKLLLD